MSCQIQTGLPYFAHRLLGGKFEKDLEQIKGRVQPKQLFLCKPSASFIHMDVCNENSKKYFIFEPENFRHQKSKSPLTHPIVTFSSLLIGRNTTGNHRMCSYCSLDAELLFPGCGVTVPRMWSYCSPDVFFLPGNAPARI